MQLVYNNPYRLLGLLVGANAVQVKKHTSRIPMYVQAGDEVPEEYSKNSLIPLGPFNQTPKSLESAISNLNRNEDKLAAALFWFFDGNFIDEGAFQSINDNNIQEAIRFWSAKATSQDITENNLSIVNNFGTVFLAQAKNNNAINEEFLRKGIEYKIKLLESDLCKNFVEKATDGHFKISKNDIQKLFLNQLLGELDSIPNYSRDKIVAIVQDIEFSAKSDFLKGFIQGPIDEIQKSVDETENKRKANVANANTYGKNLFVSAGKKLQSLKQIISTNDIKYNSIADKAALEIFYCARDYFMNYRDTSTDPGEESLKLFHAAASLAIGNMAKQKIQENIKDLKEWIDEKPIREEQKRIKVDLDTLMQLIENYENKPETVNNAKLFLAAARPNIQNIKSTLGVSNELYLGISTRVASDAQGMCVSEINKIQEQFTNAYDNLSKMTALVNLKTKVNDAWDVTLTIGAMDLLPEFRTKYNSNKSSLQSLKNQLASVASSTSTSRPSTTYRPSSPTSSSSEEGIPDWLKVVGGIILLIILAKACN
jgi:hypothetical protein